MIFLANENFVLWFGSKTTWEENNRQKWKKVFCKGKMLYVFNDLKRKVKSIPIEQNKKTAKPQQVNLNEESI